MSMSSAICSPRPEWCRPIPCVPLFPKLKRTASCEQAESLWAQPHCAFCLLCLRHLLLHHFSLRAESFPTLELTWKGEAGEHCSQYCGTQCAEGSGPQGLPAAHRSVRGQCAKPDHNSITKEMITESSTHGGWKRPLRCPGQSPAHPHCVH